MSQKSTDDKKNGERKNSNTAKRLGLPSSGRLELRKTVEGGTVKQSFAHGRTKSVSVEVKKVRTYKFNENNLRNNEDSKKVLKNKNDNLSDLEKAFHYCIEKNFTKIYLFVLELILFVLELLQKYNLLVKLKL